MGGVVRDGGPLSGVEARHRVVIASRTQFSEQIHIRLARSTQGFFTLRGFSNIRHLPAVDSLTALSPSQEYGPVLFRARGVDNAVRL
ncbi:hypothetical protein FB564_2776 [Salinispora arenicola]|uniref:Uncharacterized protein n=1 Tax=Salinispora arenicola TaxID=168697 RepID=A0A542XP86_SALAC|nr:hypothetical protein FB564_2776 [Salinispora arenicola]